MPPLSYWLVPDQKHAILPLNAQGYALFDGETDSGFNPGDVSATD
jgi:hypothetical protein